MQFLFDFVGLTLGKICRKDDFHNSNVAVVAVMDLGPNEIADLTTEIFAAALNPSRWVDFLQSMHRISGGVRTHIAGRSMATGRLTGPVAVGYDRAFITSYEEYYCHRNVWIERFAKTCSGTFMRFSDMCSREILTRSEFYNEWLKPQEDIIGGGSVMLHRDVDGFLAFGGHISARDIERLDKPFVSLLHLLTPHIRLAVEISRTFQGNAVSESIERSNGQNMPATLLIGADGKIIYRNTKAVGYLALGAVIRSDVRERIFSQSDRIDNFLRAALHTLDDAGDPASMLTRYITNDFSVEYILRAARFSPESQEQSPFGVLYSGNQNCILLTIEEKTVVKENCLALLRRNNLTRSEIEVAVSLAETMPLSEIAEIRRVSINTVRNQRQTILAKLNVKSQGQLIRLMLRPEEFKKS